VVVVVVAAALVEDRKTVTVMTAQLHPRYFCHRDRRSSPRSASASRVLSVKDDVVRGSGTKSQRRGRRRQRYHHRKDVCRCVFYLGLLTREYCLKALLANYYISNDFLLRDGHVGILRFCSLPLSSLCSFFCCLMCAL